MGKKVGVLHRLPKSPQEVDDMFQRCMKGVMPTVEEFLSIATWAYRVTPEHERAMACVGIIARVGDAWIRSDRENLPLTGSSIH
jgi:hypothetical protein